MDDRLCLGRGNDLQNHLAGRRSWGLRRHDLVAVAGTSSCVGSWLPAERCVEFPQRQSRDRLDNGLVTGVPGIPATGGVRLPILFVKTH
jgi:hypothetical protein